MKRDGLPVDDPLRAFDGRGIEFKFSGDSLDDVLDTIIESWPSHRSSDHLRLEVTVAFDADRKCRLPSVDAMLAQGVADMEPRAQRWYLDHFAEPSALDVDKPVPGCGCPECTGIPADHPARQRQRQRRQAGHERFAEIVEAARRIPITQVVGMLDLGEPVRRGKSVLVRCPLHDDHHPSMSLDTGRGLWFCHPCSEGGDGIRLYMRARRIEFAEAVRELAA